MQLITISAQDPRDAQMGGTPAIAVGARIADDAVNVCDVVAHTRWTVSTASTGGSVLTFGV